MKYLFYIAHPKQVYMYRYVALELLQDGHFCVFLAINKEISCGLLEVFGMEYYVIGDNKRTMLRKLLQQAVLFVRINIFVNRIIPDVYIGTAVPCLAITARLRRKPYVLLEDTRAAEPVDRLLLPFITSIMTYKEFGVHFGRKHVKVNAILEMLYLHDSVFVPDESVLKYFNFSKNEQFVILRFVSWNAFHDVNKRGLSAAGKARVIDEFSKHARVIISTEYEIEEEYKHMCMSIPIHMIHSLEYYAELVFGESPTMTTEAAMLGTPSICVTSLADDSNNNFKVLKQYGLSEVYLPEDENMSILRGIEVLKMNKKAEYRRRASSFRNSHINYVKFLKWYITSIPDSIKEMKVDPEISERFY